MSIRASAAVCDITPDYPLPLAGITGIARMSEGTGYPLNVSAIHIRGGAGGCILLSLDLWTLAPAASALIRKKVCAATGTRKENVFVTVTGCTSAPFTENALYLKNDNSYAPPDDEYINSVVEKSVKAASEAAVSSKPASIAVVTLESTGTGAIVIKGENGRVIAAVITKDDAPDYLGKDNRNVSADFVGALRDNLTRRFGGEPVIAFIPKCCTDQAFHKRPEYGTAVAGTAGQKLADELISKLKTLKGADFSSECSINGAVLEIAPFPHRNLPQISDISPILNSAKTAELSPAQNNLDPTLMEKTALSSLERSRMISLLIASKEGLLAQAVNEYEPCILQTLSVGPIKIVGMPCNLLPSTAREISSFLDNPSIWLSNCTNGTLMGSVLTCHAGENALTGVLFSPLYERDSSVQLINAMLQAAGKI